MSTKFRLTTLSFVGLMSMMTAISFPVLADSKKPVTPTSTTAPVQKTTPASPESTSTETEAASTKTIVDVATEAGTFKTLTAALKAAGLDATLEGQGPFTVFAPTDKAFAALPAGTVETLLKPENKDKLVKILTYHVVPGSVLSKDLKSGAVKTVEGSPVAVKVKSQAVMVNNAKVTSPDIQASNGVIHVIDRVILPPEMTGAQKPMKKPTSPLGTTPGIKPVPAPVSAPTAK